jgi:outer membrane protein TolC
MAHRFTSPGRGSAAHRRGGRRPYCTLRGGRLHRAKRRDSDRGRSALTREQAIRQALARKPTLSVAREQVAQARARVTQATALPEPSLGCERRRSARCVAAALGNEDDLSVGITIPYPRQDPAAGPGSRGRARKRRRDYSCKRQLVVFQTNQAYDSLLVSLKHRQDLEEARKLTQDFLDKTQARFNAGTVAKLDVIKAQVGVAQAENDLIANERGVANARAGLNRVVGRVRRAYRGGDSLTVPGGLRPISPELEAIAMNSPAELRGLASEQAGARAVGRSWAQRYLIPTSTSAHSKPVTTERRRSSKPASESDADLLLAASGR